MVFSLSFLVAVIAIALLFDVINGFHDSANSIATIVSTRVLRPYQAVLWAAFFNLVAMFVFVPKVAETISKIVKIEASDPIYLYVILCGLTGAILWDLLTWWLGLPTSSSHALIGGLSGAGFAHAGSEALRWDLLILTTEFILLAPFIGFIIGAAVALANFWLFRNAHPSSVDRIFRKGQLFSAAFYSLGHGANDAQKTMGVILALLIAAGVLDKGTHLSLFDLKTAWIIFACHLAMSIGTVLGGWRIVKTMGMRITKLKPIGGFSAETGGAFSLFLATQGGIPVSTTQTITTSIMGVGAITASLSHVKWGLAAKILWSWVLTIPASALLSMLVFKILHFWVFQ